MSPPANRRTSWPGPRRRLLLLLLVVVVGLTTPPGHAADPATLLESGDIVFRNRGETWGRLAALGSRGPEPYGHVGMAVRDGTRVWVVHAHGTPHDPRGRVTAEPAATFLAGSDALGIYRLRLPPAVRQRLGQLARAQEGTPFDADFDLATPDRLYCTELIWRVVRAGAGLDLATPLPRLGSRAYIPLDALRHPDHVTVVTEQRRGG